MTNDSPDAGVQTDSTVPLPDAAPPGNLAFVRNQSAEPGLYTMAVDGGALLRLGDPIALGAEVDGYTISAEGAIYREVETTNTVMYHVVRLDGSVVHSTAVWPWQPHSTDLGITGQGGTAWFFYDGELTLYDFQSSLTATLATPLLFAVDRDGDYAVGGEAVGGVVTYRAIALDGGATAFLGEPAGGAQQWVIDDARDRAYYGDSGGIWAVGLSGSPSHQLFDDPNGTERILGVRQETGEVVVKTDGAVLLLDPESGETTFTVELGGQQEQLGLAPDGSWFAAVQFFEGGSPRLTAQVFGGTRYEVELSAFDLLPWNCCCGGPAAGTLALSPRGHRLVVPIEYRFGMCACACMEEPPPPAETPLELLVVDLEAGPRIDVVPHNGACTPVFSASGAYVAFCDNGMHIVPMAGGYLQSGVSVHEVDTGETSLLTDPLNYDGQVGWAE